MAASFGPETQVLWYNPRAHTKSVPRSERVYLLWPAWAHRVMAPEVHDRPLNPLALAVLRLLAASRLTARELASHLGIHMELAAYVVAGLQSSAYLDGAGNPTDRGRELLENERDVASSLVPGWVFRDPWNGSLWPFVARDLLPAATATNEWGYPDLVFGTTGKPWIQRAFLQDVPAAAAPSPPVAREILRAASEQRRIAGRLARTDRSHFWDEDGPEPFDPKRLDLRRVSQIEAEPHPVYLATFLYVPKEGPDGETDWHVCDFFGRSDSLDLRRLILDVADDSPHLARELDRVIGRTLTADNFQDLRQRERARQARAQLLLDESLTLDIRRYPIHSALARLLDAWLELQELGASAGPRRCDNVLRECRTVLEGVFAALRKDHPLTGIWKRVSEDDDVRSASYREAAKSVGFLRFPEEWLHVKRRQIRSVSDYDNAPSLLPLVVATLVAAERCPSHPLWSAATTEPALLERIQRIRALGNKASHYGDDVSLNSTDVRSGVDDTLKVVASLLGLAPPPSLGD